MKNTLKFVSISHGINMDKHLEISQFLRLQKKKSLRVVTTVILEQAQLNGYVQSCIIAKKSTLIFKYLNHIKHLEMHINT